MEKEVQAAPSRYHNRRQRRRGSRLQWETSFDRHTPRQVSDEATYELLQEASRRGLTSVWSLTWGAKLDEGPGGIKTTLFPEANIVMMVYGGCPPSGRHRVSNPNPRAPTHCDWGHGLRGVTGRVSHIL
jgi:hypothetical protein